MNFYHLAHQISNRRAAVIPFWLPGISARVLILALSVLVIFSSCHYYFRNSSGNSTIVATAYADSLIRPIVKTQSGLVVSDTLTTGDSSRWHLFGTAIARNATHVGSEDASGLHIGVLAPSENRWSGFFAISPLTKATLFHVRISLPDARPIKNMADVALYVQQEMYKDPRINSIGCGADIFPNTTHWAVGWGQGNSTTQTFHQTVYTDSSPNQPATRECTLVTNGDNDLTTYIDGKNVFSSKTMHLNMPRPFQSYLESQTNSATSSNGRIYVGTFTDYYETTSEFVTVTGAEPGSIIKMTNGTGVILSSASASANGTALLDIGKYHMPIKGSIQVFDAAGVNMLASTPGQVGGVYGGDMFSVSNSPQPTSPRSVISQSGFTVHDSVSVASLLTRIESVSVANKQYNLHLQSTSSISSFKFIEDQKMLALKVDEESIEGFTLVSLGHILVGPYTVMVDGKPIDNFEVTKKTAEAGGMMSVKVPYTHGPHDITIIGMQVVPEFPPGISVMLISIFFVTIIVIAKRIGQFEVIRHK